MNGYPGSKAANGAREQIISLMPAHQLYVEPYLGGGAVLYAKKPAAWSIVNDADADVVRYHQRHPLPNTEYRVGDALDLVASLDPARAAETLVYLDPPYHPESRSQKKLYHFEADAGHHSSLLVVLQELRCFVILSGYRCAVYDQALASWHRVDYRVMTRGGPRIESAWCNFRPGEQLHDVRFIGKNFRERERIKRKRNRWQRKFERMPAAERAVIREALDQVERTPATLGAKVGEEWQERLF